jgi:hypothetical protein
MLFPTILTVDDPTYPEISFAPEIVRLKLSGSIYNPVESAFTEISTGAITIFLKHYCAQGVTQSYPSNLKINFRNDCDSAIQNLTLSSKGNRKEVLFLSELPPGKTASLIFMRSDTYNLQFEANSSLISVHSSLKITASVKPTTGIKQSFQSNWFKSNSQAY